MRYFRLNPECHLSAGSLGAALYDILGRRIFLLDKRTHDLLRGCETAGAPADHLQRPEARRFLGLLVRLGLGGYHPEGTYVDKLLAGSPLEAFESLGPPPSYTVAAWTITDRCDHHCSFCPVAPGVASLQACRTCVRRGGTAVPPASLGNPSDFLRQLAALGIRRLQIRGGNPLLEWERLIEVLGAAAAYPRLRVGITCPGTGRSVAEIRGLYDFGNVQVDVVLHGFRERRDRYVPQPGDVFLAQCMLLDALRQAGLSFSVTVMVSDEAVADTQFALRWIMRRWGAIPCFAEIRQLPQDGPFRLMSRDGGRRPLHMWRDVDDFFHRLRHRACLDGGFEIATDGSLHPCAGIDAECGRVVGGDLGHALRNDRLYDFWKASKDRTGSCRECPLGPVCFDCLSADLFAAKDARMSAAYCPVMSGADLHGTPECLEHEGFLYLLGIDRGLELCPA